MSKTEYISYREIIFQIALHALVLIFYSFDRHNPVIETYRLVTFFNYAIAAAIINYFLLPRFYYPKKQVVFFLLLIAVIGVVILIEELVLEQIYFPGTRKAETFPGIFYTLLDVLPVMTILVGFKFGWDAFAKQRELDELRVNIQESEIQFLKSQINPHFLFNNLNNIYAYTVEDTPKAQRIILELSAVLRYMLYECKEKFVPLSKEITQLENFTQLNQLQIEERGVVSFNFSGNPGGYRIAPLILIVFIENAFKHSQASQSENILISIDISLSDKGQLDFVCKNNYHSNSNTQSLSQGIGLENVRKRLQLLYPNVHELKIVQSDVRYEVYLSLQLL